MMNREGEKRYLRRRGNPQVMRGVQEKEERLGRKKPFEDRNREEARK
jgi:hypothetical protein